MCHILNIYTDYMCHMYIRDTHLLGLGALWGPLFLPVLHSVSMLSTIRGNRGCPSIFSSPEGARHLLKPWTDWRREGRRVCRARQVSSPPAPVRVPPVSRRHGGANDATISQQLCGHQQRPSWYVIKNTTASKMPGQGESGLCIITDYTPQRQHPEYPNPHNPCST